MNNQLSFPYFQYDLSACSLSVLSVLKCLLFWVATAANAFAKQAVKLLIKIVFFNSFRDYCGSEISLQYTVNKIVGFILQIYVFTTKVPCVTLMKMHAVP